MPRNNLRSRLRVYVDQLANDDDNAIRHFIQENDIDELLESSSDSEEELVQEHVNILVEQPQWHEFMWLVHQYMHSFCEQTRMRLLAKIFILGEMNRLNEHN